MKGLCNNVGYILIVHLIYWFVSVMVRTESLLWGTIEAILIIGANEISCCALLLKIFHQQGMIAKDLMNEYQSDNN